MIGLLTCVYLACFCGAAVPGILRIVRRQSSADCSLWREWLVFCGVLVQLVVFAAEQASWPVLISPIVSACSVGTLLGVTYRFR